MNDRKLKITIYLKIFFLVILLAGCTKNPGEKKHFWQKNNNLESYRLFSVRNANNNTPVALDLVFVYNSLITGELLKMNADEWYEAKPDFMLRFRNSIQVLSHEVVPLSKPDTVRLPSKHRKAISIIMFAKYMTKKGNAPADITTFVRPLIRLDKDNYSIVEE